MKKILLILCAVTFIMFSCSDESNEERACYEFTITGVQVTEVNGEIVEEKDLPSRVETECDMTEKDAETHKKNYRDSSSTSNTLLGVTTVKTTTYTISSYRKVS